MRDRAGHARNAQIPAIKFDQALIGSANRTQVEPFGRDDRLVQDRFVFHRSHPSSDKDHEDRARFSPPDLNMRNARDEPAPNRQALWDDADNTALAQRDTPAPLANGKMPVFATECAIVLERCRLSSDPIKPQALRRDVARHIPPERTRDRQWSADPQKTLLCPRVVGVTPQLPRQEVRR